eukprot:TRINITY_DN13227_c0_g1_i2.p1 TRINITY_DN13227_c0_g1~~TRINITY_DN13227_c0_g1_i2.p1  ORF type:complete len:132 (-),score=3.47 TRINITY_DN13227_c0_g1_i2:169-528(-)
MCIRDSIQSQDLSKLIELKNSSGSINFINNQFSSAVSKNSIFTWLLFIISQSIRKSYKSFSIFGQVLIFSNLQLYFFNNLSMKSIFLLNFTIYSLVFQYVSNDFHIFIKVQKAIHHLLH